MIEIGDPAEDPPSPEETWLNSSEEDRVKRLQTFVDEHSKYNIDVVKADDFGRVILDLDEGLGPDERGVFLRELEQSLKEKVDPSIYIYLTPKRDKNKLREFEQPDIQEG